MAAKQKYDERFVKIAKVLCMRGGTDEDLADAFEVSPRTINRWKKDYPEFAEALAAGKEYADAEVELSLYKRAKGSKKKTKVKKHSQLTADGQKHDKDNDGCLDAGTVVTCQEVRNVGNDIWMKAPSGWMAAYYDGKVYIK